MREREKAFEKVQQHAHLVHKQYKNANASTAFYNTKHISTKTRTTSKKKKKKKKEV